MNIVSIPPQKPALRGFPARPQRGRMLITPERGAHPDPERVAGNLFFRDPNPEMARLPFHPSAPDPNGVAYVEPWNGAHPDPERVAGKGQRHRQHPRT